MVKRDILAERELAWDVFRGIRNVYQSKVDERMEELRNLFTQMEFAENVGNYTRAGMIGAELRIKMRLSLRSEGPDGY